MVWRTDQKKYTQQLNTRHKLHLCREAPVTALTVLPLENTVKPHKWNPLVIQLQLFYSWLLWCVLPLPEPSMSCLESKPPSAALLPPIQKHKDVHTAKYVSCAAVIQLKIISGYLNAFGKKEGMKQVSTCTRRHRHLARFCNTLATASTSEKKCTLGWGTAHRYSWPGCFSCSQNTKSRCDELNLMKKIQFV